MAAISKTGIDNAPPTGMTNIELRTRVNMTSAMKNIK